MAHVTPDPARRADLVATDPPPGLGTAGDYEYARIVMPPGATRSATRQVLTEHAEYGRWELARVQVAFGGGRRIWLRRRIIRVRRTA